jgi:hypothetical protein
MKQLTKRFTILALVALSGCATGYYKNTATGGYSDMLVAPNVAMVSINGNGFTSDMRAVQLLMLRCADLTLERGYRCFVADGWSDQSSNGGFTMPGSVSTTWSHGYASSIIMPPTYVPIHKPAASITITMGRTPEDLAGHTGRILDATYVRISMRSALNLK